MKIVIVTSSATLRQKLSQFVQAAGHVVVGVVQPSGIGILEELARATPHVLVLATGEPDHDTETIIKFASMNFHDLLIAPVSLQGPDTLRSGWQKRLSEALKKTPPLYLDHSTTEPARRLVFHDPTFSRVVSGEKRKQPHPGPQFEIDLASERRRFQKLLAGARAHHADAKSYREALIDSYLATELEHAYRLTHDSYKGLSWSRDWAGKWCAVLAHYVPNICIEYLPKPAGIHAGIDYIHFSMPVEAEYGIMAVTGLQPSPSQTEMLLAATQTEFTGQSDSVLLQKSCTWRGMAWVMQFVANAHVSVMDRVLAKDESLFVAEQERVTHRQMGVFRDFWDLHTLFHETPQWEKVLRSFWKNPEHPDFQFEGIEFPTLDQLRHSR